jgi:xanthine dehydrogenase YagS FAD-binding subunit
MNPFTYQRVDSFAAAFAAIAQQPGARFIAGGTNILDLMKDTVEQPPLLVDINRLGLTTIESRDGGLAIGALARMTDVARDERVRSMYPMVAIALEQSASPQLRNMASIGGNMLQRPRCPYFRDPATPCNKRAPGSGCGAIGGINRMEAVLGTSEDCIASHPSDLAVALVALDAVVNITGPSGSRDVPVREFFLQPGSTPAREHAIDARELIVGVTLPPVAYASRSTYLKARDRSQYEFALASAAVALDVQGGRIANARIALGGVGTVPWRAPVAEAKLRGVAPSDEAFSAAADAALTGAAGQGQNDFKIPLAKRTLIAALREVSA